MSLFGLAPLRPVMCFAMRNPEAFRRVFLLIGCRDPQSELFRDDVIAWSRRPHLQVELTVDRGGPAWRGHVGVVTKRVRRVFTWSDIQFEQALLANTPTVLNAYAAR